MTYVLNDLLGAHDRLIMDPVHGGISLYAHEVRAIDHPLFQRLRHICQNDILSLVFPGATHSRFLHSIGVMHIGGRMFRTMVSSRLTERSRRGQGDTEVWLLPALDYLHKVTRLACLLHDCGHSSFSHQFTQARSIRALLSAPDRFRQLWSGQEYGLLYPETPTELEHEHYSVRCAWQILQDIGLKDFGINPLDVLGIMETTHIEPSPLFCEYAAGFWQLVTGTESPEARVVGRLVQGLLGLIISGEIDADRADYMLRDGFHSSVTIGSFNLDHLLNNLQVGWTLEPAWLGLAITAKGLGALEDFVYSRHQMYRRVYGHKTSIGFDWLLRQAIDEVLEDDECRSYVETCLSDINEFQHLTDNYFWELFRRRSRQPGDSHSRRLVERRRPKHLLTKENLSPEAIPEEAERLARHFGIGTEQIVSCTLRVRFSNIGPGFDAIRVLVKDPLTRRGTLKPITDMSDFFAKFQNGSLTHFYLRPGAEPHPD